MSFKPAGGVLVGGVLARYGDEYQRVFKAQQGCSLATTWPYARVRHSQDVGFIVIMVGFLLQWPTLLTLAMLFPVLVTMYVRLAHREVAAEF